MTPAQIQAYARFMLAQFNGNQERTVNYLLSRSQCLERAGFPLKAADYRKAIEILNAR